MSLWPLVPRRIRARLLQWAWEVRRSKHVAMRGFVPEPYRPHQPALTPWVWSECDCPCECPNAFIFRSTADVAWPSRCGPCTSTDLVMGYLTERPDDDGYVLWYDNPRHSGPPPQEVTA